MHQVCLVSDQLVPNFLPVQNPGLKPERLTMAVSDRMRPKAENLKGLVEARQIKVEEDLFIPDPMDIRSCRDAFEKWLEAHEGEDVVLNVTGGTKPMAIAAQEAFRMAGRPVFYVDINTDRVSWIGESGNEPVSLEDAFISLKDILALYGFSIESGEFQSSVKNSEWMALAEKLAENKWYSEIGCLNMAADSGRKGKTKDCQVFTKDGVPPNWALLMGHLYDNKLISDPAKLCFTSREAQNFCCGGWLEHLTFLRLKELGFKKKQAMMNLKITDGKSPGNEFDCAVVHRNRLYVIECKTRNMKREDVADQAIYKLAELARIGGGLRAQGVLVSCRPVRQEDHDRAKVLGVKVIDRPDILKEDLQDVFGMKKQA